MIAFSADLRNLAQRTATWSKAAGVTFAEGLRKQAGLLKQDLWMGAPPKNRSRATKDAEKDIKARFYPKPKKVFPHIKEVGGKTGMVWMYAAPLAVVGVKKDDYKPGLGLGGAIKILNNKSLRRKGVKWFDAGRIRKGKSPQHASILNRVVVSRGVKNNLVRYVRDRFGRQKAAWAIGIEGFGARRPPQWIARHFGKVKGGNQASLTGDRPFIRIWSRARGVQSKASIANVRRSVRKRMSAMKTDMRLYLNGIKKKAGFSK